MTTVFVDTNVLVYARDTTDPRKHTAARSWMERLWSSRAGRLSTQVLHEYYVTVTRKLHPGLSKDAARSDVRDLAAWQPIALDDNVVRRAWAVEDRFDLSFWDALIVAAAQSAGCRYVLSEDLQHGQDLHGVEVLSPFQSEPSRILETSQAR